jgi:hypothetical protein
MFDACLFVFFLHNAYELNKELYLGVHQAVEV